MDTSITQIHDCSPSWLGTGISKKKSVSSMTLVALLHTVAANGVFTTHTHTHTYIYMYINRVVGYNKQSLQC
jgi:hypothetical protein